VAALIASGVLAPAAPWAVAHERSDVDAVLDSTSPPLPAGVEVVAAPSVAEELVVTNSTATPLTVLGTDGTPFVRVDAGEAQANVSSPDWLTSSDPEGAATGPSPGGSAASSAPPRWQVVSGGDSWAWFDSRIQPPAVLPPSVTGAIRPTTIGRWQIPVVFGSRAGLLRGRFVYQPVVGSFRVVANRSPAGVIVSPLQGRLPGLFVADPGGGTIIVRGLDGRPFLRLGPGGADVDPSSPSWAIDRQARGLAVQVPPAGSAWAHLSDQPSVTWLDPRLDYPPSAPGDIHRSGVVRSWSIPIEAGAQPATLTGTIEWMPSGGSGGLPTRASAWWIVWTVTGALATVALAALLVLFAVRPTRRR
jgi:hypothetical protein